MVCVCGRVTQGTRVGGLEAYETPASVPIWVLRVKRL